MKHFLFCLGTGVLLILWASVGIAAGPIELWPHGAPGEKDGLPPEGDTTKTTDALVAGKRVIRLGNVTNPTISVFLPSADKANGAASSSVQAAVTTFSQWISKGRKSVSG